MNTEVSMHLKTSERGTFQLDSAGNSQDEISAAERGEIATDNAHGINVGGQVKDENRLIGGKHRHDQALGDITVTTETTIVSTNQRDLTTTVGIPVKSQTHWGLYR